LGIVATGEKKGIYIKTNTGWIPIASGNTQDVFSVVNLFEVSALFDVIVDGYYIPQSGSYVKVDELG